MIDKSEVASLIPHSGSMCLLDGVMTWDDTSITCVSRGHRERCHPLRRGGRLAALHAFEYSAQAVAVHGGLLARAAGARAAPAYLAALRDGRLYVDYLDDIDQPLQVSAEQRLAHAASYIYDTRVEAAGRLLAQVRVTVMGNLSIA